MSREAETETDAETPVPTTYDETVQLIAARYDGLAKRLKQVARYALDNPNDFALKTTTEIAEIAEVQPSALVRFAKGFGFDGFPEMQRLFQQRLLDSRPSYSNRLEEVRRDTESGESSLLSRFARANIAALEHLIQEEPTEKLERAIEILDQAEIIHILGMRRAYPIAASLFYALTKIGRRAVLIDNNGGLATEQSLAVGPKDALFVCSFAHYTSYVAHTAELAHLRGTPVIALTDHPLSPLTPSSDVCFYVEDAAVHDFRSLGASLCLTQALVVGLGAKEA